MPSLVLCYAPEDEDAARRLGGYLEANLDFHVAYGECVVSPELDLVDTAERGLSAEAALILLSPHSVPRTWKREKWEPVFFRGPEQFGTLLGFVLLEDCRFPELIRSRHFFDAREDLLSGARLVRRWLLRPLSWRAGAISQPREGSPEAELQDIVDLPGVATDMRHDAAVSFAGACEMDFEASYTWHCLSRTRAGILGEMGHALGVPLAGTVHENRQALAALCRNHRYLFLFENVSLEDRDFLNFGGRSSVVFTWDDRPRTRAGPDEIAAAFLAVPRDDSHCALLLGDAVTCMSRCLDSDFELGLRFGWAIVSVLRVALRFAETVEVLDSMEQAARRREDTLALYRIEWEQSWVRESAPTGEATCILPTAAADIAQLSLF